MVRLQSIVTRLVVINLLSRICLLFGLVQRIGGLSVVANIVILFR